MAQINFRSRPIPSIIQGVSQQAAQQRRDAQCEAQFDCVNSPVLGVVARPGADVMNFRSAVQRPGAFTYKFRRGIAEDYLMVLYNGTLEVYDLNTGNLCSVTDSTGGDGYLASTPGVLDEDNFRVVTLSDYTFIVNRSKVPAYTAATAPTRPKEALVFFQAGNYNMFYMLSLAYGGTTYDWQYKTPDNSSAQNAQYIYTNQLAATFYRAMTGTLANSGSGEVGVGSGYFPGDPGGGGTSGTGTGVTGTSGPGLSLLNASPTTATSLGFGVAIDGNLLRIWRNDGNDFTIDVSDGTGGTSVTAFKETVPAFSDLPKGGFSGLILKVVGASGSGAGPSANGYWVQYNGNVQTGGYWEECPAPGVHTTLDPATMPHAIFNSGVGAFQILQNTYLPRICGDGIATALDPGFVGKPITYLDYYQGRLVMLTESTCDFSKALEPYDFFPDTAQEQLATDPISITLAVGGTTAIMRASVSVDENLLLWAQLTQFRVNSGVQPLQPTTIQYPPTTAYQFTEQCNFQVAQTGLYFVYEPGPFATLLNLQYQQGRVVGETDVTAHVPAYIPAGSRMLTVSQSLKMAFIKTDGAPSNLYHYNYLNEGASVVQSAWNAWRMPAGAVLWCNIDLQTLYVLHQRADGLALLKVPLNLFLVDPGGTYLTRLDLRLPESGVTMAYNATTGQTTITLPYQLLTTEHALVRVIIRTTGTKPRGSSVAIVSASGNTVVCTGNLTAQEFYIGLVISSSRQESEFFLRTATGSIPTEKLTVKNFVLNLEGTVYSRVDIVQGSGQTKRQEFLPMPLHSQAKAVGGEPTTANGSIRIACDTNAPELSVTITNDTPFPSRWIAAEWQFVSVERPTPMLTPYGGPVQ